MNCVSIAAHVTDLGLIVVVVVVGAVQTVTPAASRTVVHKPDVRAVDARTVLICVASILFARRLFRQRDLKVSV